MEEHWYRGNQAKCSRRTSVVKTEPSAVTVRGGMSLCSSDQEKRKKLKPASGTSHLQCWKIINNSFVSSKRWCKHRGLGNSTLPRLELCGMYRHCKTREFCLYATVCVKGEDKYTWLLVTFSVKHISAGRVWKKNEAPLGRIWCGGKRGRGMREANRIQRKAQKKSQLWRPFIFNAKRYCDPKHSDAVKNLISQEKKSRQMGYSVTSKWKHIFVSHSVCALQSSLVTSPSQYQPITYENTFFLSCGNCESWKACVHKNESYF